MLSMANSMSLYLALHASVILLYMPHDVISMANSMSLYLALHAPVILLYMRHNVIIYMYTIHKMLLKHLIQ